MQSLRGKYGLILSVLIFSALFALPITITEAQEKDAKYVFHGEAGGPSECIVHHGTYQIPPALTSESRFRIAGEYEAGQNPPTIHVGTVSAKWTTIEDNVPVQYELDMILKIRETTAVAGIYTDSTWPGKYGCNIQIANLDVEGIIKVNGQTYPLSKPDYGTLYMLMWRNPSWGKGNYYDPPADSTHFIQSSFLWQGSNPDNPGIKPGQQFSIVFIWSSAGQIPYPTPIPFQSVPCVVQIRLR